MDRNKYMKQYKFEVRVAPPAGAWIETLQEIRVTLAHIVAPPAGAWIETYSLC